MTYTDSAPQTPDEPSTGKEKEKKPTARMRRYWREIEAYNKAADAWKTQGETIVKLYLDQHRTVASPRRFALLWSNIETLKPAVYGKLPVVLCSRRYKDPHPTGRIGAELLERATNTTLDLYKADEVFRMVRDDRLLVARGQGWARYEADVGDNNKIKSEKVCIDYVHWLDFGHNVCGTWRDVWVVWRKVYMGRKAARERFGKEIADKLTYSGKRSAQSDTDPEGGEEEACIFEIWDKRDKKVCWMSRDCPEMLDDGEPPLNLRDFFPCPEPCYGSRASKSLIPTPDYRYYQDQCQEIDDLTEKIANLTDFLIVRGFIPAGPSADGADAIRIMIQQLQSDMTSNKSVFVPVESWAGFAEKGGSKGLIDWMPVEQVVVSLKGAIEARQQLIQDVYQITGISDILRGETDPDETLGAQQLKAQTSSRRVRNAKDDLSRFCRDIAQLVAEIVSEVFQPQTIADMTGFKYQPPMPPMPQMAMNGMAPSPGLPMPMNGGAPPMQSGNPDMPSPSGQSFDDKVLELIRNDRMRGFLIDIETDSTIQPDEDAEKQRRTEFLTAMGGMLTQAAEIIGAAPTVTPMITEFIQFGVRGFRVGRNMEDVIERTMQQVQQQAMQPRPDPEQAKMQMQADMDKQKLSMEMMAKEKELELKERELQIKVREAELKMQLEAQKAQQDAALRAQESQQEMAARSMEVQQDAEIRAQEAAMNQELAQREGEQKISMQEEQMRSKIALDQKKFAQSQRQQAQKARNL